MTEEQAKQLLQKYLDGNAEPAEARQVEEWYNLLQKDALDLPASRKAAIGEEMLLNLRAAMNGKAKTRKIFSQSVWWRAAALLAIVVSIGLAIWKLNNAVPNNPQVVITTQAGEQKTILLSDGSEITIGPLARVVYPKQFAANSRKIALIEGEVFFSVAHEENRPFTVQVKSGLDVKVLGTSFRVSAYAHHPKVKITVATGKVAITKQQLLLGTLVKGQQLEYNKANGHAAIHQSKHEEYVKISFDGETLAQVARKIGYIYGVKVVLTNKTIAGLKCRASFTSKQQPEEILDILCSLHHLKFSAAKNHKTFKIYP
ncbi:fec operon regulator FecR [compost metagenome]